MATTQNYSETGETLQEIEDSVDEFEQNVDYLLDEVDNTVEPGEEFSEYLEDPEVQEIYEEVEKQLDELNSELAMLANTPEDLVLEDVKQYKDSADLFQRIRERYERSKKAISKSAEEGELQITPSGTVKDYLDVEKDSFSPDAGNMVVYPDNQSYDVSFEQLMEAGKEKMNKTEIKENSMETAPRSAVHGDD